MRSKVILVVEMVLSVAFVILLILKVMLWDQVDSFGLFIPVIILGCLRGVTIFWVIMYNLVTKVKWTR